MKKAMKKLLCVVLVLMMAMPLIVLPASAEAPTYDDFEENDLMYKVNFKGGDGVFKTPGEAWAGMSTKSVSGDGKSVTLKPESTEGQTGAIWGNKLEYPNYRMVGSSYAAVFTLTASDANQEIGFYPDWNTGFIIKPGSNSFRYGVGKDGTTIEGTTGTYTRADGEKPLTQTYAIEIKDEGSDNGYGFDGESYKKFTYNITEYNLYVLDGYDWQLLFQFSAPENADAAEEIESNLKWITEGYDNYEYVIRFYRNRKDANQDGTVKVSNMDIYKGLAVTNGAVEMDPRAYYQAADGEKLFAVEFDGTNTKWEQTYGKPSGISWAEMTTRKLSSDKKTVTLTPGTNTSKEAAVYGGCLDPVNYPAQGNSYTIAYTVTASDANQEVSLYADWSTGFSVIPGQNKFGYKSTTAVDGKRTKDKLVVDYTEYEGTGSLTQTYAVEFKLNDDFSAAEYNFYVAKDGEWVHLYSLDADELDVTLWTSVDCEVVIRFCRDGENEYQTDGTVTISDINVYKGFAAKSGKAAVPGDYVHKNYDETAYGEVLYKVNFKGDATYLLATPPTAWGGMDYKVLNGGAAVTLEPTDSTSASIFGNKLDDKVYGVGGRSYTMVFTVTASDADEEVGLYPDWSTGFVVIPGKNQFRYNVTTDDRTENETVVNYTTYDGNGSLTQTYAVEFKVNDDYTAAQYNLYAAKNGEWVHVYSLKEAELAKTSWGGDDNDVETVIRFYRDSKIKDAEGKATQDGTVTISNMSVYKGLAATTGMAPAKAETLSYAEATDGSLLYNVNFKGTSGVWSPIDIYEGLDEKASSDGSSITLKLNSDNIPSVSGGVRGGDMQTVNTDPSKATYPAPGAAYTVVFTVSAEDENQSVGFLGKWRDGFFVTPGKNEYSLGKVHNNKDGGTTPIGEDIHGVSGTYAGAKSLTQTYAIEFANGTDTYSADGKEKYTCEKYNLWVLQDGVWILVCELNEAQRNKVAWDTGDYEFVLHFARIASGEGDDEGSVTISDMKIYKGNSILPKVGLINGASVRLDNPTGIRFTGSITKEYYNELSKDGKVTLGVLIAPTDYIHSNQVMFTKEAFDAAGVQYLTIDGTLREEATHYKVNCAMVNMNEGNYERNFSARLYVAVDGEIVAYSAYSHANNSRSIAEVAERAYNNVKATKDDIYKYATTLSVGTTVYSPYENRDILKTFIKEDTSASLSVMTYNIRAYGDAEDIWDKITGDYEGWAGRDPVLALGTITELMPDVVGLQEDDSNLEAQYQNVPALAENYVLYNAGGNGNENNGIWVKKGIAVLGQGTVYYKTEAAKYPEEGNITGADFSKDTKGDNDKGRFFRWVLIEKNGEQFLVVNTHLHYRANDADDEKDGVSASCNKNLRKAQATIIRLWLAEMASTCSNQIVMGDMNAQGDSQEMKYGLDQGTGSLDLAANNAIIKGDVGGTLIGEGFGARQPWVYDHVFYSAETLKAYEYSVVDNFDEGAETNYPSDHLPVIAKFIAK